MHNTRCVGREKRCTIRTCLRLSGPLHRTSTLSHGGEATGTRSGEFYPCPRQRDGPARTRAVRTRPAQPAPVAQWIEQAPSKRLAAGSSPAGGAHPRVLRFPLFPRNRRSHPRVPDRAGRGRTRRRPPRQVAGRPTKRAGCRRRAGGGQRAAGGRSEGGGRAAGQRAAARSGRGAAGSLSSSSAQTVLPCRACRVPQRAASRATSSRPRPPSS